MPQQAQKPDCPICGGVGYTINDVPMGHPDFGKAIPCACQAQARLERRLQRLQRLGSIDDLDQLTFDNFIPEPAHLPPDRAQNLRRAYETALGFAEHPEGWLLFTGAYGCGKTHLAAAIANARLEQGQPALFMVVPDLLDHLRATFGPNSEVSYDELFDLVRSTPLLILDDLGSQNSSAWASEKLFQLLNHRYNAQLPTVITSNQRLEELDPRLRSRLLDGNVVTFFPILAPDFRAGLNPSSSDLSTLSLHRDKRFENFNLKRADLSAEERNNLQDVFRACRRFAEAPRGWLVLAGTYGCGKTHLAAAVANHQVDELRNDAVFVVVPDLLDHLRAAFGPQATTSYDRRFDEIKQARLLILDDLGTESASAWAKEKLFQLLNYRYNALLPTVITTSSKPNKIEPWLRTRMFDLERCQFWGIIAPGYRGSSSQRATTQRPR
jgi:DNA replication protein DnaC